MKIINVKDGRVTAVFLAGEGTILSYGTPYSIEDSVEIGVGDLYTPPVKTVALDWNPVVASASVDATPTLVLPVAPKAKVKVAASVPVAD